MDSSGDVGLEMNCYENHLSSELSNVPQQASSTPPRQRFSVKQVHMKEEPERDRERSVSPEAQSRPLSATFGEGTIGYATNEAIPMTVFYRNENTQSKAARTRPTLQELRKGFEAEEEQQNVDSDGVENGSMVDSSVRMDTRPDPKTKVAPKFGWLKGVMFRCLLNIWGVIIFLRVTWVVGQSGMVFSSLIMLLSALVTIVTTLSMSAICTNGEVKGGGAYYLISRSLGPEFGGSIGLIFSVANAVAIALYVVGFGETVRDILKDNDALMIDETNDIRIVGFITVIVLLGVTLIGLEWVVRTQMVLFVILIISIFNAIIGTFIGPKDELSRARGFVGYNLDTFKTNIGPNFQSGENFFSVFAIFFPAATGILAGVNISGDLKNAQKAIPKGTLLGILISTLIYLLLAWFAGSCVEREATGVVSMLTANMTSNLTATCANQKCEYGLLNDYQVMEKISAWGPIVTGGIFAATLSSALASFVGAPKTFQAVCKDNLFPYIGFFGKGIGPGDEPRRAYILSFVIAAAFIAIGELNIIAPVISNFFLMSYALINYAVFAASLGRSPGWRPSFKYYNMWVSLAGAMMCVAIMFLINWWAALLTIVIVIGLYKYVDYKKPQVNWGSSAQAYTYIRALRFTYRLNTVADHVKNFRPQCLVLTGPPSQRPNLAYIASHMTKNIGLMVCGQVNIGPFSNLEGYENKWLRQHKIRSFHTKCTAPSLRAGVQTLLQTVGLGKLKPNTLVLGFKTLWKTAHEQEIEDYVNIINDAFEMNYGVVILRVAADFVMSEDGVDGDEADTDWVGEENEEPEKILSQSTSGKLSSSEGTDMPSGIGRFQCEVVDDTDDVDAEEEQDHVSGKTESSEGFKFHSPGKRNKSHDKKKASVSSVQSGSLASIGEMSDRSIEEELEKFGCDEEGIKGGDRSGWSSSTEHQSSPRGKGDAFDDNNGIEQPPQQSRSPVTDNPPIIQLELPSSPSPVNSSTSSAVNITEKASTGRRADSLVSLNSKGKNTEDNVKHEETWGEKQGQGQGDGDTGGTGPDYGEAEETTMLFPAVQRQRTAPDNVKLTFTEKVTGNIDVWWLFDDGGLTILIPYLLSLSHYWKGCKLRIFTLDSTRQIKTNQLKMASLLKKFRIDFSSIEEVRGINRSPSEKSIKNFLKLPLKEELKRENLDKKTLRHIRIGELLREKSLDAQLIVMSLPVPRLDVTPTSLYMSWLEILTANLPPVLLVRGNQSSVLTFYS